MRRSVSEGSDASWIHKLQPYNLNSVILTNPRVPRTVSLTSNDESAHQECQHFALRASPALVSRMLFTPRGIQMKEEEGSTSRSRTRSKSARTRGQAEPIDQKSRDGFTTIQRLPTAEKEHSSKGGGGCSGFRFVSRRAQVKGSDMKPLPKHLSCLET